MIKRKNKPKLDFERNKLLQQVFKQYDNTFALTLDTCDYIENKDLKLFRKFVRKEMKKSLRRVRVVAKQQMQWNKQVLRAREIQQGKLKILSKYAIPVIKQRLPKLKFAFGRQVKFLIRSF